LSSPIRLRAHNGAEHGAIAEFQRLQWMQTDMSIALAAGAGQPVAHRSATLGAVANEALNCFTNFNKCRTSCWRCVASEPAIVRLLEAVQ
jgi:hypothetical protein